MMKGILIAVGVVVIVILGFFAFNQYIYNQKQAGPQDEQANQLDSGNVAIIPISHASFVLSIGGETIYNDPTGGAEAFEGNLPPGIILLSDIHGDHLDSDTLKAVSTPDTVIIAPKAVADELPDGIEGTLVTLNNGEKTDQKGINIEAVPMYNFPETSDARHTKGRGNGYILQVAAERIYIAGDTGPTPEMKALKDIDIAFIPMNPPFTMTVEEAAEAVLAFKPHVVHPYHYRGQDGLSDVNKFKQLVEAGDPNVRVDLINFYPKQ